VVRAVVFDLWQTLAVWPEEKSYELRRDWSGAIGVPPERLHELWASPELYRTRETGPIAPAIAALYEKLGVRADVADAIARRIELTRETLVPVDGAVATLTELRKRGVATGLISNCTEEVPLVWDETPFAGLFDAAVFSATAGCMKPDARIYEAACDELGVDPRECLFVGDGANDELRGALEVGMTPVLLLANGSEPAWDGLRDWTGRRIATIPEILDLVR
jgi:putative hydrolase of the HAD superfamily